MPNKLNILFLCTGNSCRSQMAEGFCRKYKSSIIESFSAGIEAHGLNKLAVEVMKESGIDISRQWSKTLNDLDQKKFDYVITLCGHANEVCPIFPGPTKHIHVGFDDPPLLAKSAKTKEEALYYYRKVRDEIKTFIISLPESL